MQKFIEAATDAVAKAIATVHKEAERSEQIRSAEHRAFMAEQREMLAEMRRTIEAKLAEVENGKDGQDGKDGEGGKQGDKGEPGQDAAPIPAPAEDPEVRYAQIESTAGMALLKSMTSSPVELGLPPVAIVQPVKTKSEKSQVNVTAEIHLPRKSGEKTVVTKHDEKGRIVEFERHEIEE